MHILPHHNQAQQFAPSDRSGIFGHAIAWRRAIREHRDARGDDRCWVDDYKVWTFLADTPQMKIEDGKQGMIRCLEFHRHRNADSPDQLPPDAVPNRIYWDDDLRSSNVDLPAVLAALERATRAHRDLPPGVIRTADHDRRLYLVLPEKVTADFRLPPAEEFLGRSRRRNASCPNFWASHTDCLPTCSLHSWGPNLASRPRPPAS